jgi:GTP diphosphokinase / guanosine-3',5'-bis(diphosphate) 3'-diphosphatase
MTPTLNDIISLIPNIKVREKALITKAYSFAEKAHAGTLRKNGDPYFVHAVFTAQNLAELEMEPVVIAAGLLHDVIEDTSVTEEELKNEFGEEILNLVEGVSKLGKVRYKGIERNVENLRKFFISVAKDIRVLIIKLADRLHNIETLEYVRPDKQKRIALETLEIYAPLANRLSMGKLKGRLEDAAFKYAFPKEYGEVEKLLIEKKDANIKHLIDVKNKIEEKIISSKIKNFSIDYRQKHLYSLWKKLQKYHMDIDKIYDIIALRVMVKSVTDCYHILGLIHGEWTPVPNRIKDYIATPKMNGYQSLHTTIFTGTGGIVEIQIRTHKMHEKAENGMAAHFIYKEKDEARKEKQLQWIDQLRTLDENGEKDPSKFLKSIKMDFFNDRVFIFTPRGDIIDLPVESSVIDFAYAIHTDIGNHVQGAKINGKNSTLGTKLNTHDIVEIQTNKNAHPTSKWLNYAKTGLARKHINNYLKSNSLLSKFLSFGKN